MRSAGARQNSRAGFTRNLENAVPLGFANDVKIPQSVTRASLSRAEHAYEFCDRLCSHQRDVVGGIQSRSSPARLVARGLRRGSNYWTIQFRRRPGIGSGGWNNLPN